MAGLALGEEEQEVSDDDQADAIVSTALLLCALGFVVWGCVTWDAVPVAIGAYLAVLGARRG